MLAGHPTCPVATCPQGSQAGSLRTAVGRQVDLTHQGFLPQLAALGSRDGSGLPARPILPPLSRERGPSANRNFLLELQQRHSDQGCSSQHEPHTLWVFTHSPLVSQKRSRKDSKKVPGSKVHPPATTLGEGHSDSRLLEASGLPAPVPP